MIKCYISRCIKTPISPLFMKRCCNFNSSILHFPYIIFISPQSKGSRNKYIHYNTISHTTIIFNREIQAGKYTSFNSNSPISCSLPRNRLNLLIRLSYPCISCTTKWIFRTYTISHHPRIKIIQSILIS